MLPTAIQTIVDFLGDAKVNKSIDTLLKTIVGFAGCWWFFRRLSHLPRLNLAQTVTVIELPDDPAGSILIKVDLRIENIGEVPFSLKKISVGAVQTVPLPPRIRDELSEHGCIVDEVVRDGAEVAWTGLAVSEVSAGKSWSIEVRPKEVEHIPITLKMDRGELVMLTIISQLWQGRRLRQLWRQPLTWRIQSLVNLRNALKEVEAEMGKQVKDVTVNSISSSEKKSGTAIKIKVPGSGKRQ